MATIGMNHFTILTDDVPRTVAFYHDLLGLTEGYRPDLGFPGAWLYAGAQPVLHVVGGKPRAALRPGETLLVLGAAGGVGTTAVELGKQMGATVIAAASSDAKLELVRKLGADHLVNYATQDLRERLKEITRGRGVDVIYDPVGGALAEPALRSMAWNGRYLVIGFAGGDIPRIPLNLPLLKGCSIVGVFWGSFAVREAALQKENATELWRMFEDGRLKPVVGETHPLVDYAAAFASLAERRAQGKVVVVP